MLHSTARLRLPGAVLNPDTTQAIRGSGPTVHQPMHQAQQKGRVLLGTGCTHPKWFVTLDLGGEHSGLTKDGDPALSPLQYRALEPAADRYGFGFLLGPPSGFGFQREGIDWQDQEGVMPSWLPATSGNVSTATGYLECQAGLST